MPKNIPRSPGSGVTGDEAPMSVAAKESSAVSLHYPILTTSNYAAWAIKMKVYMKAQEVWDAIEDDNIDVRKDQMALAAIYGGISEETLFVLAEKQTAKAAWEALKTIQLGADRMKEAKVQTLKAEFEGLRMKETESVNDFAVKLTTIVNQICALDDKVEESHVVKKFLRVVPKKFLQIASMIEQFGDSKTMTAEEVIGRLKVHEERLCGYDDDNDEEHLLLTRAEWKAREKKREGEGSSGVARGQGRRFGKFDKAKVMCYNCNNYGHFSSECPEKKKEALLVEVQSEDEHPALLCMSETTR